jgi:hypothetical protein
MTYFDLFLKRWCSRSLLRTTRTFCKCLAQEELKMRISSKNTRTNLHRNGRRTSFINARNVAGVFVKPKGMTKNSNNHSYVWKAVFSMSSRWIRTWWSPEHKSNLMKNLAPFNSSSNSSTPGIGNMSFTVTAFSTL